MTSEFSDIKPQSLCYVLLYLLMTIQHHIGSFCLPGLPSLSILLTVMQPSLIFLNPV